MKIRRAEEFKLLAAMAFVFGSVGVLFWDGYFSEHAQRASDFIYNHEQGKIVEIFLEPTYYKSLITEPIVVSDRHKIAEFADSLDEAIEVSPNNPITVWAVTIKFSTDDGTFGGELSQTTNHGCILRSSHSVEHGLDARKYRIDSLGKIVVNIVQSRNQIQK